MEIKEDYALQFITDIPHNPSDPDNISLPDITRLPNEGIYIYDFIKGKILYSNGWKDVIGYHNDEISMKKIVMLTSSDHIQFVREINDKALYFLHQRNTRLTEYHLSFGIKMKHRNGMDVPVSVLLQVYATTPEGELLQIMGRFKGDDKLRLGRIRSFSVFGPEKEAFEQSLNNDLVYNLRISNKELEVIKLLAQGKTYKEIADDLSISKSAVEKRVAPLFKRFNVKNNAHLVGFAYENLLLP
jgi:DNA-binding CsgD family transcriptional regulator